MSGLLKNANPGITVLIDLPFMEALVESGSKYQKYMAEMLKTND